MGAEVHSGMDSMGVHLPCVLFMLWDVKKLRGPQSLPFCFLGSVHQVKLILPH